MNIDNPLVRASDLCTLCDGLKPIGTVCCWNCYRQCNLRNGNPTADAIISRREVALQAEQN
jgi:hypothetical protein